MRDPSVSRRDFVSAASLGILGACVRAPRAPAPETLVYVGTYTTDGRSRGIYLFRMDPATGALRPAGAVAAESNPSFLAVHPGARFVYAVSETREFEGRPTGAVSGFARDAVTGALRPTGRKSSRGGAPCYLTVDRTGRFLLVANYLGGSFAVLPLDGGGRVGDASSVVQHVGQGTDPVRQAAPHAHCIVVDAANRFALTTDLGLDRVRVYGFDASAGTLSPAPVAEAAMRPGAGPRHLALHPGGRTVYVANELDSTVTVLGYDPRTGALAEVQTLPAVSEPARGPSAPRNAPADVHVHPSGGFLYVSNRGHDSIAVFAIDARTGALEARQLVPTGGSWPRNFALDPAGRFLFVANQRSDSIVGYRIDAATGRLTPTGQRVELPAPVCIRFVAE